MSAYVSACILPTNEMHQEPYFTWEDRREVAENDACAGRPSEPLGAVQHTRALKGTTQFRMYWGSTELIVAVCFHKTHLLLSIGKAPPRTASAPRAEPRPHHTRKPGPDTSRAAGAPAHTIVVAVLEPHRIRGAVHSLPIHARRALAPSAGPIVRGGRFDGVFAFRARVCARASDT
jgi:hypothetical protein